MFKRRYRRALLYFEARKMIETEDSAATLTLFSAALVKNAERQERLQTRLASAWSQS